MVRRLFVSRTGVGLGSVYHQLANNKPLIQQWRLVAHNTARAIKHRVERV